jgi:hypothetical protein
VGGGSWSGRLDSNQRPNVPLVPRRFASAPPLVRVRGPGADLRRRGRAGGLPGPLRPSVPGVVVSKLISVQDRGRMAGLLSGGREPGRRWELLRRPRWLVGTSEPCPAVGGGTIRGTRNGRGLRLRVGSGGGGHRPEAPPRSARGRGTDARVAGATRVGGAPRRGSFDALGPRGCGRRFKESAGPSCQRGPNAARHLPGQRSTTRSSPGRSTPAARHGIDGFTSNLVVQARWSSFLGPPSIRGA